MNTSIFRDLVDAEVRKFPPDPKLELLALRIQCRVLESVITPEEPEVPKKERKKYTRKAKKIKRDTRSEKFSYTCVECGTFNPTGTKHSKVCPKKVKPECYRAYREKRDAEYRIKLGHKPRAAKETTDEEIARLTA